jgi:hypothetical protein
MAGRSVPRLVKESKCGMERVCAREASCDGQDWANLGRLVSHLRAQTQKHGLFRLVQVLASIPRFLDRRKGNDEQNA